ncbi:cupin domain-containing protein [Rhodobacter sp. SY28-1]|uniref:cupin domain-containing protein n=1 Tax=Rhodobacter sp. SY28-1 TaxID=2562317 RepID=UPI0010C13B09|nr:cupin domain-containing protein [Rhodobacter sp. SY28-1]
MTTFDKAAFSHSGAGIEAFAFGRHIIRITADQTGGSLGCFEDEVPAGEGPPYHVHEKEDEFFRVLEGRFAFWCNGARVDLAEGGVICVPRGSVHRFQNIGASMGRIMVVVTPGGFEGFFHAVDAVPGASMDQIGQIAAQFNLRFVFDAAEAA